LGGDVTLRARAADILRFLVRPTFCPAPMAWGGAAARTMLAAGLVHAALGASLLVPLWLAGRGAGVLPAPGSDPGSLAASPLAFLVIAPLLEELLFRGWLTGRVAALRFAAAGFAAMALMLAGVTLVPGQAHALGLAGAAVAFAGLIHWGLTRDVPPLFVRHFGAIAWGSALLFGLVHLGNYGGLESPLGALVVLPQVLGGLLLAYLRTRIGLQAAIAYHAGYNALVIVAAGSW
jgi:membrane protease YdiL (CAAX protease family)